MTAILSSRREIASAALVLVLTPHVLRAGDLTPTPVQQATAKTVAQVAAAQHYRNRPLDGLLASEMFERFLASLDPQKDLLASEDVAALEKYRGRFADPLSDGTLDDVFAVYNALRARQDERYSGVIDALAAPPGTTSDETLHVRDANSPWSDRQALDALWRERVLNERLTLELGGRDHAAAVLILRKRYEQLQTRAAALQSDDVFQLYVDAYARSLDPHSEYFLPHRAQRASGDAAPLEGIGVQLRTDREYVAIRQIFDGGAADRSGRLHTGDRIVAVGQGARDELVDVIGWTLDPVVDLIRGPVGSAVRLEVLPKGADLRTQPAVISLVRDRIDLREQGPRKNCGRVSGLRICTIAIPRFYIDYAGAGRGGDYAGTGADVARLLNEEHDHPPDGIVLDLRGNGGGALLEAARLAGLFIDLGPVVQVKHATGSIEQFPDPVPGALYDGPLAVLVDRYSASATEIFAGALHDYRRAGIIGEHTYGKGTVQETFDLNESEGGPETFGQLVLTTAEYFRVTGRSTQLGGVELDVELPSWPGAGDYGERFESNPLPPSELPAVQFEPSAHAVLVTPSAQALHAERLARDPTLRAVVDAAAHRTVNIDSSVSLNEQRRRAQAKRIAAEDATLTRALRTALASAHEKAAADEPPELLWRDLMLIETERVLADSIQGSRGDAH